MTVHPPGSWPTAIDHASAAVVVPPRPAAWPDNRVNPAVINAHPVDYQAAVASEPEYHDVVINNPVVELDRLSLWYDKKQALTDINLKIARHKITALIGPSGCGKSTVLRSINRMNDLIDNVRVEGRVMLNGLDVYDRHVDPVEVRRRVGMVFQKPNPFPRSIRDNILFGPKVNGYRGDRDELLERALRQAALWDEVKDDLGRSGLSLSGGQQQRLCIARAVAVSPEVILMDEPCSALDPIATLKIEDLMHQLVQDFTIVIVTHNMQQAARVSDYVAFMLTDDVTTGQVVEYGPTSEVFTTPRHKRTEDYLTGRFG